MNKNCRPIYYRRVEIFSPERIRSHPQVSERKASRKGAGKRHAAILTDTPEKVQLEKECRKSRPKNKNQMQSVSKESQVPSVSKESPVPSVPKESKVPSVSRESPVPSVPKESQVQKMLN